uniref:Protein kinase domain-containing protein n=1 Tax=Macrostomum lignano TaxID=282301 RepID=A0A1I8IPH0_9PLAT
SLTAARLIGAELNQQEGVHAPGQPERPPQSAGGGRPCPMSLCEQPEQRWSAGEHRQRQRSRLRPTRSHGLRKDSRPCGGRRPAASVYWGPGAQVAAKDAPILQPAQPLCQIGQQQQAVDGAEEAQHPGQALTFEIFVHLLRDHIAHRVFELFLRVGPPALLLLLGAQPLPQRDGVLNAGYIGEVGRVGDAQAAHAVRVTPFGKMALKRFGPAIRVIAADLARVVQVQAVQLVQPVGDGLAVPAERQVLRVVRHVVLVLIVVIVVSHIGAPAAGRHHLDVFLRCAAEQLSDKCARLSRCDPARIVDRFAPQLRPPRAEPQFAAADARALRPAPRPGSRSASRRPFVDHSRLARSSRVPPHFNPSAVRADFRRSKPREASSSQREKAAKSRCAPEWAMAEAASFGQPGNSPSGLGRGELSVQIDQRPRPAAEVGQIGQQLLGVLPIGGCGLPFARHVAIVAQVQVQVAAVAFLVGEFHSLGAGLVRIVANADESVKFGGQRRGDLVWPAAVMLANCLQIRHETKTMNHLKPFVKFGKLVRPAQRLNIGLAQSVFVLVELLELPAGLLVPVQHRLQSVVAVHSLPMVNGSPRAARRRHTPRHRAPPPRAARRRAPRRHQSNPRRTPSTKMAIGCNRDLGLILANLGGSVHLGEGATGKGTSKRTGRVRLGQAIGQLVARVARVPGDPPYRDTLRADGAGADARTSFWKSVEQVPGTVPNEAGEGDGRSHDGRVNPPEATESEAPGSAKSFADLRENRESFAGFGLDVWSPVQPVVERWLENQSAEFYTYTCTLATSGRCATDFKKGRPADAARRRRRPPIPLAPGDHRSDVAQGDPSVSPAARSSSPAVGKKSARPVSLRYRTSSGMLSGLQTSEGTGFGPSAPAEPALASRSARSLPRKPAWPGIHLSSTRLPSASPLSWVLQSKTDLELVVLRQRARRAAWLSEARPERRAVAEAARVPRSGRRKPGAEDRGVAEERAPKAAGREAGAEGRGGRRRQQGAGRAPMAAGARGESHPRQSTRVALVGPTRGPKGETPGATGGRADWADSCCGVLPWLLCCRAAGLLCCWAAMLRGCCAAVAVGQGGWLPGPHRADQLLHDDIDTLIGDNGERAQDWRHSDMQARQQDEHKEIEARQHSAKLDKCFCRRDYGKIAVRQAQIAQSWQSSVYTGNEDYCFMMRPRSLGDWNYFHSGEEPDASGYQWLLIKLAKPARLVAVTVFARPGELKRRAVGTEVLLLGEQVPNGLLQPEASSHCLASLAGLSADGATNGIFQCGRVRTDDAESAKLDFACHQTDCARLTRFILLRRLVRDQADKIFNFVGLEIEESQSSEFLTCEMRSGKVGDCTRNGLYQQRAGRASQLVKACLPCQLTVQDEVPSCQLTQPGSQDVQDLRVLPVSRPQSGFLFMLSECPQCGLRCSYRCSGQPGALRRISDTILFHEPPKAVKLLFRDTNPEAEQLPRSQYWPADQLRTIVFFTESAFPKPEHSCLLTGPCLASGTELIPTKSEILSSAPSSNGIPTFSLLSKYRLFANKSISRCSIRCYSRSQGSPGTQQPEMKEAQLPQLVYECNTVFHVPTRERWIEGAVLDLKVDSSKNNPVPTLHTCSLRTVYGFIALNPISTTLKTSTYRLNATRSWGTHVAIVCQVNQSGVHVQSNVQHPLPDVLYTAETEISSCMVDQASIRVTVVTTGGIPPPNSVLCGVGKDAQSVS